MPYPAVLDHRIPYDNDGTVCAFGALGGTYATGIVGYLTGAEAIEYNDEDQVFPAGTPPYRLEPRGVARALWNFFPEQREVTGLVIGFQSSGSSFYFTSLQGSNDTTNGVDGTWETASIPGGSPFYTDNAIDGWRKNIKAVSFVGGKRTIRWLWGTNNDINGGGSVYLVHWYGEKVAGQTPNDIIYIDHDTTPGVEFGGPEDFGDRPLGTSVVRQFRVKNVSPTLTANAINIQCNDPDFAISTDNVVWVVTINIGSLAAGAESATMFIRNTTPAPGNVLGPRFSRLVTIVGSWS